jgi:hypothetical protein
VADGLVACLREERAPVSAKAFALWRRSATAHRRRCACGTSRRSWQAADDAAADQLRALDMLRGALAVYVLAGHCRWLLWAGHGVWMAAPHSRWLERWSIRRRSFVTAARRDDFFRVERLLHSFAGG